MRDYPETVPTSSPPGLPARIWRGLPQWARVLVLALGCLLAVAWAVVAMTLGILLYNSPLRCPPTVGCTEHTTCSATDGLLWTGRNSEQCEK
jgi:hypothetical protein